MDNTPSTAGMQPRVDSATLIMQNLEYRMPIRPAVKLISNSTLRLTLIEACMQEACVNCSLKYT